MRGRITVRQLEALVRLSEALARLRCTEKIVPAYVREVCSASSKATTSCGNPKPSHELTCDKHPAQVQSCLQKSTLAGCWGADVLSDILWCRPPDIFQCFFCQCNANPCAICILEGVKQQHACCRHGDS